MAKSLERVEKPDGSFTWELVELRAANLYEKDKPAPVCSPKRRSVKKAADEESTTTYDEF